MSFILALIHWAIYYYEVVLILMVALIAWGVKVFGAGKVSAAAGLIYFFLLFLAEARKPKNRGP